MILHITMKTPDCVENAIKDNKQALLEEYIDQEDVPNEDDILYEERVAAEVCARWFQYGEYLTVRVDTDAKTIEVLPA